MQNTRVHRISSRKAILTAAAAAVVVGSYTQSAMAAAQSANSWKGTTSTTWSTGANWTLGALNGNTVAEFNSNFTGASQPSVTASNTVSGVWLQTGLTQNVTIDGTSGVTLKLNPVASTLSGFGNNTCILMNDSANHSLTFGSNLTLAVPSGGIIENDEAATLLINSTVAQTAGNNLNLNSTNASSVITLNAISGTTFAASLIVNSSGAVNLNGANQNTAGDFTLTNGAVKLGASANLPGGKLTVTAGSLDLNGTSQTVGNFSGVGGSVFNNSGAGTSLLTIGTLIGTGSGTGGTYAGIIKDDNGTAGGKVALTKIASGTITVSGNNSYTGVTTINGGILEVGSLANGGANSGMGKSASNASNLVIDGGALQLSSSYTQAGDRLSTDRLFTMGTGGATINAANMTGGSSGKNNGISLDFTNTGSLAFTATAGPRTLTLGGSGTAANSADKANIFNPMITDQAAGTGVTSLVKSGTAVWQLAGANTYTGSTTISGGGTSSLVVTSLADGGVDSNIGKSTSDAANLVFNSGELLYRGAAAVNTNRLFTVTGGVTAYINNQSATGAMNFTNSGAIAVANPSSAAGLTFNTGTASITNTFAPQIVGNVNISTAGSGKWTLSGVLDSSFTGTVAPAAATLALSNSNNTYSGATNVTATLAAGASGAFSPNSDVTVTGGTLDTTGYTNTVKSLTVGGSSQSFVKVSEGKPLTVTNALTLNTNAKGNTIGITDTNTLGTFTLVKYGSIGGTAGAFTGTNNNSYRLVSNVLGANEIDAQHLATLGTTAISKTIIAGATADIGVSVKNDTPTGSDSLDYSVAAPTAVGTFTSLGSSPTNASGTLIGGATAGNSTVSASSSTYGTQAATFVVTPTATGSNQLTSTVAKTVTANLNVKDHSNASFDSSVDTNSTATLDLGTYNKNTGKWESGNGSAAYAIYNLVTTSGYTAGLDLVSITAGPGSDHLSAGIATFSDLATYAASTTNVQNGLATFNPIGLGQGKYDQTYTLTFADHVDAGSTPQTMLVNVEGTVVIPEPSTICMLLGVAGMGFMSSRRRQAVRA